MSQLYLKTISGTTCYYVLVILALRFERITAEWKWTQPPNSTQADYTSIVRICIPDQGIQAVACLGVSIDYHWIVASISCYERIQNVQPIELYTGSKKMDCRNGQLREAVKLIAGTNILFIKLSTPFAETSQVSLMPYLRDDLNLEKCYVFCGQKLVVQKRGSEIKETCKDKLWKHSFTMVPCQRQVKDLNETDWMEQRISDGCIITKQVVDPTDGVNKEKACGSIVEHDTPCAVKYFKASTSPIICGHHLAGFVRNNQDNPYLLKLNHIKYDFDAIEERLGDRIGNLRSKNV